MNKTKEKYIGILFFVTICLVFIQRFAYNALYYPVMDDWFLYGDIYKNKVADFIVPNEKFAIRPIAGLIDIFVASPLFKHLWTVEIMLSVFMVVGVLSVMYVLRKNDYNVGGIFVLLLCLLPLNFEATYWIAASIRISGSIFFVGISCYMLNGFLEEENKQFVIGYGIVGFITVGFYEPAIVVYAFLSAYLVLKKKNKKYYCILGITFLHILAIGIYYLCNGSSAEMETRGHLLTSGIITHTAKITAKSGEVLTTINLKIFLIGLKQGFSIVVNKKPIIQLFATVIYSVSFGAVSKYMVSENGNFSLKKVCIGIIMIVVGLFVFYILEDTRVTVRSVYFAVIGIGILIEEILMLLSYKIRCVTVAVSVTALSLLFTVSGWGIVDEYQNTSKTDMKIVKQILDLDYNKDVTNVDRNTYLLGAESYYKNVKTVEWFESVRGACSNYADITGCMRHMSGVEFTNNLTPIKDGEIIKLAPYIDTPEICRFFALENDDEVINIVLENYGDYIKAVKENGELYGTFASIDGEQYLFEK